MKGLVDPIEVARVLRRLTQDGWMVPVHYSAISNNGSMVFGRYMTPDEPAQIIASHASGRFVLPMSMMVVDERGQAALITWSPVADPVIAH